MRPHKTVGISLGARYTHFFNELKTGYKNSYGRPSCSLFIDWSPAWFSFTSDFVLSPSAYSILTEKIVLEPRWELAISRYFEKPHIGISVTVDDVLHSGGRQESWIRNENFVQHNLTERTGRSFIFKIYWRFGKYKKMEDISIKAIDR